MAAGCHSVDENAFSVCRCMLGSGVASMSAWSLRIICVDVGSLTMQCESGGFSAICPGTDESQKHGQRALLFFPAKEPSHGTVSRVNWHIPFEQIQVQPWLIHQPERECFYKYKFIFLSLFTNQNSLMSWWKSLHTLKCWCTFVACALWVSAGNQGLTKSLSLLYRDTETVQ